MKHFRILLPLLALVLALSACADPAREPYTYTFSIDSVVKTITVDPEKCTILDGTDVYDYVIDASGSRTGYVITYPNGATYHWTETGNGGAGGWSDNYDSNRYISGNILVWALQENQPREKTGSPVAGLLLIALGAVNFLFPEAMFHLRKGWMFRDAEPSDAYLAWSRLSGVIVAVGGLVLCFV